MNRDRSPVLTTLFLSFMAVSAFAEIQQDRLVSGGGPAAAATAQVSWAALGEPLGGAMTGGGLVIEGGGGDSGGNLPPQISGSSPANKGRFYRGDSVVLSMTASDPEGDPLQYRFLIDGQVLQDWSSAATATWDTGTTAFGWHTVRIEVKDPTHTVARDQTRLFVFWRPPSP